MASADDGWKTVWVPATWDEQDANLAKYDGVAWYRTLGLNIIALYVVRKYREQYE